MSLMPTGNDDVWMIRVRDRGTLYKIDMLELLKAVGITKDAWGQELPPNRATVIQEQIAKIKSKKAKKEETEE